MNKRSILEYLDETVHRFPDKAAISRGTYSLTFSTLRTRAMAIGSGLIKSGYRREAIAVLMDRHPDTVCAFLGVQYAGCFYICIDPDMPDTMIRDIADKSRAAAVICNEKSLKRAEVLYGRAEIILFEELAKCPVSKSALSAVRDKLVDTDPAYIVFTSGSTGEPKGVCTPHRAVVDYAEAICSTLGFDEKTVFGNQAPLYYDAPLKELLPVICLGASCVFVPKELFSFPVRLCEFIREQEINTLCWAASALSLISSVGALEKRDMSHLRTVCFGSEVFALSDYKRWRSACPNTRFINLYGPTEATGMSAYWIAEREIDNDEAMPIGRPFPNTELLVLNEAGERCGEGESGEIYIRGSSLAHGYYNDRDITGYAFVQNPLNGSYPELVYKTGDMARYNEHGELVYLGRCDRQIKVMGRRIEPFEIERCASGLNGVACATLVYEGERGMMALFYVGDADERTVKSHLSLRLPRYMLPNLVKRLDRIPQKENGKIDTVALIEKIKEKTERIG